jgi:hypothetical protein
VKRREFITLLGGTAVAWPLAARGQHIGRPARVGLFASDPENPVMGPASAAFLDELRKLGFTGLKSHSRPQIDRTALGRSRHAGIGDGPR